MPWPICSTEKRECVWTMYSRFLSYAKKVWKSPGGDAIMMGISVFPTVIPEVSMPQKTSEYKSNAERVVFMTMRRVWRVHAS